MKAQYPSISYTLFIVISIMALSMMIISINTFTDNVEKNYANAQLNYAAEVLRDDILKLYSTNAEGEFQIGIPDKIIGKQYSVEFDQDRVRLSLIVVEKLMTAERLLNIDASFSGKSYAPVTLEMRKVSGNVFIRLI